MEITSKELREVEFRERLRGYDTTEVDEFLERVAVALDELHVKLRHASERAERPSREREVPEDEEALRRTLVLAQRAADMAIREAQEESAGMLDSARAEAETILTQAHESARRVSSEAQKQLHEDVEQLKSLRDQLRTDVRTLSDLFDNERRRLKEALAGALKWVEEDFSVSPEMEAQRSAPLSREGTDVADSLNQQLSEDADAAQVSAPTRSRSKRPAAVAEDDLDLEDADQRPNGGRSSARGSAYGLVRDSARLSAVSEARADTGLDRDTQAWRIEDSNGEDWSA
jgi:cell division initiation protein